MLATPPTFRCRRLSTIVLVSTLLAGPAWPAPAATAAPVAAAAASIDRSAEDGRDVLAPPAGAVPDKVLEGILVVDVDRPLMSQIYTWADGSRQMFVAVAEDADLFEALTSTLDLPFPASYRVLNLSVSTPGTSPEPVAGALRHCAQVAMLAQMEPERWRLEIRMEDPSWTNLSTNGLAVTVHFGGVGQFRCSLVTK